MAMDFTQGTYQVPAGALAAPYQMFDPTLLARGIQAFGQSAGRGIESFLQGEKQERDEKDRLATMLAGKIHSDNVNTYQTALASGQIDLSNPNSQSKAIDTLLNMPTRDQTAKDLKKRPIGELQGKLGLMELDDKQEEHRQRMAMGLAQMQHVQTENQSGQFKLQEEQRESAADAKMAEAVKADPTLFDSPMRYAAARRAAGGGEYKNLTSALNLAQMREELGLKPLTQAQQQKHDLEIEVLNTKKSYYDKLSNKPAPLSSQQLKEQRESAAFQSLSQEQDPAILKAALANYDPKEIIGIAQKSALLKRAAILEKGLQQAAPQGQPGKWNGIGPMSKGFNQGPPAAIEKVGVPELDATIEKENQKRTAARKAWLKVQIKESQDLMDRAASGKPRMTTGEWGEQIPSFPLSIEQRAEAIRTAKSKIKEYQDELENGAPVDPLQIKRITLKTQAQ